MAPLLLSKIIHSPEMTLNINWSFSTNSCFLGSGERFGNLTAFYETPPSERIQASLRFTSFDYITLSILVSVRNQPSADSSTVAEVSDFRLQSPASSQVLLPTAVTLMGSVYQTFLYFCLLFVFAFFPSFIPSTVYLPIPLTSLSSYSLF